MGQWDQEYVDEEGEFEFGTGGRGEFQFGYVQGSMDHAQPCEEESRQSNFPGKAATLRTAHH